MANIDFNIDDYEETSTQRGAIPAGEYPAIIIDTQEKISKAGNRMIEITLQIIGGEYQNSLQWDRLNIWHPNERPRNIAREKLNNICKAIGVKSPSDTTLLHNKPFLVEIFVSTDTYNGQTRKVNRVKGYAKLERPQQPVQQPAPQAYTQQSPW